MRCLAPLLLVSFAVPALAHGGERHADGHHAAEWSLGPALTVPLLLTALVYAIGFVRLHGRSSRGRSALSRQAWIFAAGWLLTVGAIVSPLHQAGERPA